MTVEILAPLSGSIIQINMTNGQTVKEDEEVLLIEAMKMETPVYAPCSGSIKELQTKVGDKVEEDSVLAVIED